MKFRIRLKSQDLLRYFDLICVKSTIASQGSAIIEIRWFIERTWIFGGFEASQANVGYHWCTLAERLCSPSPRANIGR